MELLPYRTRVQQEGFCPMPYESPDSPAVRRVLTHSFFAPELERQAMDWHRGFERAFRRGDGMSARDCFLRLAEVVDDDRAAWTQEVARREHLSNVEYHGRMPVPEHAVTARCPDESVWRLVPLEEHGDLWIPQEGFEILKREAEAGLVFDRTFALHELQPPRPAVLPEVRRAAPKKRGFLEEFLDALLDPAIAGIIKSHRHSKTGHWFFLCRWVDG